MAEKTDTIATNVLKTRLYSITCAADRLSEPTVVSQDAVRLLEFDVFQQKLLRYQFANQNSCVVLSDLDFRNGVVSNPVALSASANLDAVRFLDRDTGLLVTSTKLRGHSFRVINLTSQPLQLEDSIEVRLDPPCNALLYSRAVLIKSVGQNKGNIILAANGYGNITLMYFHKNSRTLQHIGSHEIEPNNQEHAFSQDHLLTLVHNVSLEVGNSLHLDYLTAKKQSLHKLRIRLTF